MNKGAHVSTNKKNLSDTERDVLAVLLSLKGHGNLTSKEVSALSQHDIRETTFALSTLVGMDLADTDENLETKLVNEDTQTFSSTEPKYFVLKGTPQYFRANYALHRGNRKGTTLWHIINKRLQFGQRLWPDRRSDRIYATGVVRLDDEKGRPKLIITYRPEDLLELVGFRCRIRCDF